MENFQQHKAEEGRKFDSEKPNWSLLPLEEVEGVVRVLTHGATKYTPFNWKFVKDGRSRYFSAMMRHLKAWQHGEKVDPETQENHLYHAMCCAIFLSYFDNHPDEEPK